MKIKLPRLLNADLSEAKRLSPSFVSVNFRLNQYDLAEMELPLSEGAVPVRSWVELFTQRGSAGIFRVCRVETDYDSEVQQITLKGGLSILEDSRYPTNGKKYNTYNTLIADILSNQAVLIDGTAPWTLDTNIYDPYMLIEANNSSLYEMLLQLFSIKANSRTSSFLKIDQSVFPWTISVYHNDDPSSQVLGVVFEGRMSRNVQAVSVTIDDSELCTRVYNSKLSGGYISSDNESIYGIIAKNIELDDELTTSQATAIAQRWLSQYDSPSISAEFDYYDLYPETGELSDDIAVGANFMLNLPSYNVYVTKPIVSIQYIDVYGAPNRVKLTLGELPKEVYGQNVRIY